MVRRASVFLNPIKHLCFLSWFLFVPFSIVLGQTSPANDSSKLQTVSTSDQLQKSLTEIKVLISNGNLLDAKTGYQDLLKGQLTAEERRTTQRALEQLNMKILFSPTQTQSSFLYEVEEGDSLFKIAKKNNTTIELVKKSNLLQKDVIRPGMKLKISKAIYTITVDVSDNKLILWSDGERLKTFPIATGKKGHATPTGTFTIVTKLENPTWYKTGLVAPSGSPDNILGTRWLGFSLDSYGIHGTTLPETIGTHASDGCVRMYNSDVEELYSIVPLKTKVTITD